LILYVEALVAISMVKIDGRGVRIIQALEEDARTSLRRIARELDVPLTQSSAGTGGWWPAG
jgi:hypothetical protein